MWNEWCTIRPRNSIFIHVRCLSHRFWWWNSDNFHGILYAGKWESSMKLVRFMDNLITVFRLLVFTDDTRSLFLCMCLCVSAFILSPNSEWRVRADAQTSNCEQTTPTKSKDRDIIRCSRERKKSLFYFMNRAKSMFHVWCYSILILTLCYSRIFFL